MEQLIRTVSAATAAVACTVLLRPGSLPQKDLRWLAVVLPLLAAAVLLGWASRVVTAGVIGANIGAGLVVAFGGPLVVAALLWSLTYSEQLTLRERNRPRHAPAGHVAPPDPADRHR